jgi:uncharacterized protein
MRALLDVNVWIALFDDAHLFSRQANEFIGHSGTRIATCPLVENGVVRVLNAPRYGKYGTVGISRVRDQLRAACTALDHEFWADDISLRDDARFDLARVLGHNQISDLYLLALAVQHKGRLVTFDQAVPISAVRGAKAEHLMVL